MPVKRGNGVSKASVRRADSWKLSKEEVHPASELNEA